MASRYSPGWGIALLLSLSSASSAVADAQTAQQRARCPRIDVVPGGTFRHLTQMGVTYYSGGLVALCRAAGLRLAADSAEYHENQEILYLFGRVRYTEAGTQVDARRMTYWRREERILAEGDVVAVLENGTRMRGPRVEYFRAVPAIRARSRLNATGRPRMSLVDTDTTRRARGQNARRADTTHVDANTVVMDGDSLVHASGQVIVTRSDVVATSDSLALDRARETARFIRTPVIKGTGERPFTLTGNVIDLYSRDRRLERVVSSARAHVVSEDLDLTADTIDLRIAEQLLQRAFAWGRSRAHAVTPTQDLDADSLDMIMPGQRLREVRAIGTASAKTSVDSTRMRTTERDWLSGDTLHAFFDSLPPADTTTNARLSELRARVKARAFYHIPPGDTASRCPNINYATGREIVVRFSAGEIREVLVERDSIPAVGLYGECAPGLNPRAGGPGRAGPPTSRPPPTRPPPPGPWGGDLRMRDQ